MNHIHPAPSGLEKTYASSSSIVSGQREAKKIRGKKFEIKQGETKSSTKPFFKYVKWGGVSRREERKRGTGAASASVSASSIDDTHRLL